MRSVKNRNIYHNKAEAPGPFSAAPTYVSTGFRRFFLLEVFTRIFAEIIPRFRAPPFRASVWGALLEKWATCFFLLNAETVLLHYKGPIHLVSF